MKTVSAVAFAVLLLGGSAAHALTFVSVAPGNWNQVSTWACTPQPCVNRIPGSAPGDSVTINAGHTIVMNYAIAAGNELTSFTNNGTLTMATGSTANLRLGTGTHTSAGPIEFGGGVVGTSGTILQLNANSSITATLTLTRITLRNAATLTSSITRTSPRTINLDDFGVIENQSGAVFEDQNTSDSFFSSNGGSGRAFNNAGTLRKTGAGAILSFSSVIPLNNSGTVTSSSGTIEIRTGTSTGSFSASGTGQIQFAGTHTMNGATFGSGVNVATSSLLSGSGITIPSGSTVTWSGGGMRGTGSEATTVAAGATLRITGDVGLDARKLVNNGTVTVASGGVNRIMNLENGATIENQSGAVWEDQNGATFGFSRNVGSGAAFNNAGTLRKTGAAPSLYFSSLIALNNSGTVTSSAGTIEVRTGTSTGTFSGSGSGQVLFAATHTMNGVVFGNGVTVGTSSLLQGSGMTVPSGVTLTWSSGGMRGTGSEATTIASGGVLRITGDVGLDARKLVNNGTVIVASGGVNRIMSLENGATVENQTGALWDDQNGANFTYDRNVGTGQAFNNAGTFRKSGSASSLTFVTAIALNNSGNIEALSGRMQVNGNYSHTGGTVQLNGGNITWSNAVTLNGGALRGNGTATAPTLTNSGTISPGLSPGTLTISGNYTQTASGTLEIELAGTTAGTQHDRLAVTGAATFGGTLSVLTLPSFTPAAGNKFDVVTFASRSGDFATKAGMSAPNGLTYIPSYSATAFTLTATTADLGVTKTAPASAAQGSNFNYTIVITNSGAAPASGINLTDTLPAGLTHVSTTTTLGTCSGTSTVTCAIGTLAGGASATVTIAVNAAAAGSYTNTATVSTTDPDPNSANNTSSVTTTVQAAADLSLTITDTPDPVVAGGTVTYTIAVANAGPASATPSVALTLSRGTITGSSGATCSTTATSATCSMSAISAGANASFTLSVTATDAGTMTMNGTVSSATPDANSANDTATATTTVIAPADLSVVKSGPASVTAGETIAYTITVKNTGGTAASNVVLTDTPSAGLTFVSNSGGCTSAFPCNLGSVTAGQTLTIVSTFRTAITGVDSVSNTATIASTPADSTPTNNVSTATTRLTVPVGPPEPPRGSVFSSSPRTIPSGQRVTLSWSIPGLTSVTISPGVGTQPASGSITLTPTSSVTYTLSGTVANGTFTMETSVTVNRGPICVVTRAPRGMAQAASISSATDTLTVTNLGGSPTTLAVMADGDFFTASPGMLAIDPDSSKQITITATAKPAGAYRGRVILTGPGIEGQIGIPVQMVSAVPEVGTVELSATVPRVDVTSAGNAAQSVTVTYRNRGTATFRGVGRTDQVWVTPQAGEIVIGPGASRDVTFQIDPSQRTRDSGTDVAELSLIYLAPVSPAASAASDNTTETKAHTISLVYTKAPTVGSTSIPPLQQGETPWVIPGLIRNGSIVSDFILLHRPTNRAESNLTMYYLASAAAPAFGRSALFPSVAPSVTLPLADVIRSIFNEPSASGTIQVRTTPALSLSATAHLVNKQRPEGVFGTALASLRGDRATASGEKVVLPGVQKDATASTSLFVQEAQGTATTARVEFLAADGRVLSSRSESIDPFGMRELNDSAPAGAVTAVVTNTGNGRVVARAVVSETSSGDVADVVDWTLRNAIASFEPQIIPLAIRAKVPGEISRTEVVIANRGSETLTGKLALVGGTFASGRRRAAVHADALPSIDFSLATGESRVFPDVLVALQASAGPDAYLVFTPANGSAAITARTRATTSLGTLTTSLPVVSPGSALRKGESKEFGGVDSANASSVANRKPAAFQSTLGLIETTGQSAVVRATLQFTQTSAGSLVSLRGSQSKDYSVSGGQFLRIDDLARDILGAGRDQFDDLRGMQLDLIVISGDGAVVPFISAKETGTGDVTVRVD